MPKIKLSKLVKKINKENEPPEGWTPEAKEGAKHAAALGLSLSDLDDGGDDGGRVKPDYGSGQRSL